MVNDELFSPYSLTRQQCEDFVHTSQFIGASQLIRGAHGSDFPINHDGYPVTIFSFVHIMRCYKHGDAPRCSFRSYT